jgi:hypothetical protein
MRMLKALLILLLFAGVAYGQTTTVTLQVTDAGAQSWNNGTYTVTLISTAGGVPPQIYYLGGVAMTAAQILQTGSLNASGGATLTLGQTVAITPVTTIWQYVVCPQATAGCYTWSQTAIGATQTVSLTPPTIKVPPSNISLVYATSEVSNPQLGSTIFLIGAGLQTCTAVAGSSCTTWSTSTGSTQTIASGTAALGTSAIASNTCASAVTVTAAGVQTTDNLMADFNSDPTAITGYVPGAMLTIVKFPTSGNVNFRVCNNTGSSITPNAVTLNWRVVR